MAFENAFTAGSDVAEFVTTRASYAPIHRIPPELSRVRLRLS